MGGLPELLARASVGRHARPTTRRPVAVSEAKNSSAWSSRPHDRAIEEGCSTWSSRPIGRNGAPGQGVWLAIHWLDIKNRTLGQDALDPTATACWSRWCSTTRAWRWASIAWCAFWPSQGSWPDRSSRCWCWTRHESSGLSGRRGWRRCAGALSQPAPCAERRAAVRRTRSFRAPCPAQHAGLYRGASLTAALITMARQPTACGAGWAPILPSLFVWNLLLGRHSGPVAERIPALGPLVQLR